MTGMFLIGGQADRHQQNEVYGRTGRGGTQTQRRPGRLPQSAGEEASGHRGDDTGAGGLLPVERRQGRDARRRGVEVIDGGEDGVRALDVQSNGQGRECQHHAHDPAKLQFLFLTEVGFGGLDDVIHHRLHAHQQIAVSCAHLHIE